MKTVTRTAFSNIKQNKSKNILIGIAICLTTLLLFLIPGIGMGMINITFEAVNQTYPTFHGLYRNVDQDTAEELKAAEQIEKAGLRSDAAYMVSENYTISMISLDETAAELNKVRLAEGNLPKKADEMVVSRGLLKAMELQGEIGDTITIPYQLLKKDGLDYAKEKEFVICGMIEDSSANEESKTYSSLISDAFVKQELPKTDIAYRVYFRLQSDSTTSTDQLEADMKKIAAGFGIKEDDLRENADYLRANYIDPVMMPTLGVVMLIVVLAGIITIYSIYYVSMVHRVQEYGRLKAIGATKRQIRQIVLREGFFVAVFAVPVGLLLGSLILQNIFNIIYSFLEFDENDILNTAILKIVEEHQVFYLHPWIYLLAAGVSFLTVYLSLLKPMTAAARISPMEALRYNGEGKEGKSIRKGYASVSLFRLTKSNLAGNKKRTIITIVSIAVTGVLFVAVSTVLSCANPKEAANAGVEGQYVLNVVTESGNKEHPELEWNQVQQNNPLTEDFIKQIESLKGVEKTETFSYIALHNQIFDKNDDTASFIGLSENYAKALEKGIIQGSVTYEELKKGDKVIMSKNVLHWYPQIKLGDVITFQYMDGNIKREKTLEIAAIGDYTHGLAGYAEFISAKQALADISQYNIEDSVSVYADKNYDAELEKQIQAVCEAAGGIELIRTWQSEYETWSQGMSFTSLGCNLFLAILGIICIMNLINTMINSIHVRKKELGMMQAMGLSEKQLVKMLNMEGMFYTFGTLLCSVGVGSAAGYLLFLYAKKDGMFNITYYHYPFAAVAAVIVLMVIIQLLLSTVIGKSLKRQSLIERIRFSE